MSLEEARGVVRVPASDGVPRGFMSDLYVVKLTADQTGDSFGMVRASVPAGGGPPPHVHHDSDEIFYLLDGELEFLEGEHTFSAAPGDAVFVPRGATHRFLNTGIQTATMLFMYTPGGPERAFAQAGDPLDPGVPFTPWTPDRVNDAVMSVLNRYDHFLPKPGT